MYVHSLFRSILYKNQNNKIHGSGPSTLVLTQRVKIVDLNHIMVHGMLAVRVIFVIYSLS